MEYTPLTIIKDVGKLTLLWVPLMAAMLSSCSNDDSATALSGNLPQDGRLRFTAALDNTWQETTRGERIEKELEQSFGLFAYTYAKNDSWTPTNQKPNMLCDQEVTMVPEGWATTSLVTLPPAGTNLQFFAYYPFRDPETASVDPSDPDITAEEYPFLTSRPWWNAEANDGAGDGTAGNPRFGFQTATNAVLQNDFLVGVSTRNQIPDNPDKFFETPVKLRFRHMLAGVLFKVGDKFTEPMTINSISITNVRMAANLTVTPPTDNDYATATYEWHDLSSRGTVTVSPQFTVTYPNPAHSSTDVGKVINSGDQMMFLIPQTLSNPADYASEGDVQSWISVLINDNVTLEAPLDMTELQRGKITVFTISVNSLAKLSLSTQIINWNADPVNTFGGSAQEGNAIIPTTAIDNWVDYDDEGSFTKTMEQPKD